MELVHLSTSFIKPLLVNYFTQCLEAALTEVPRYLGIDGIILKGVVSSNSSYLSVGNVINFVGSIST